MTMKRTRCYNKKRVQTGARKTVAAINSRVTKLAKQVRRNAPERKWAESTATASTFNYAGSLSQPVTGIAQGVGDFGNRIGDEITLTSFRLKMIFTMSGTTYGQTNRVVVAQLKSNPDGSTISAASYINLIMHSADLSTARATIATLDKDNRGWFRILADKTFTMNYSSSPGTSAVNNYQLKYLSVPVKLPQASRKISFYNGTGNITKNEIVVIVFSDTSVSQTYTYTCRMGYIDA